MGMYMKAYHCAVVSLPMRQKDALPPPPPLVSVLLLLLHRLLSSLILVSIAVDGFAPLGRGWTVLCFHVPMSWMMS